VNGTDGPVTEIGGILLIIRIGVVAGVILSALYRKDPEKSLEKMSIRDLYKRIYDWHKEHGKERIKEKRGLDDAYEKTYLDLLRALPPVDRATQGDMDFVFGEVLGMLMEWSYSEKDEHCIAMGTYARVAFERRYTGVSDERFRQSRKTSSLFAEFQFPKWMEKYEGKIDLVKKPSWETD